MKKISIILFITSAFTFTLKAQNEVDALRYSRTTFGGTARYMSMGGAFGALGADFSTLNTNPAGIGLYKSSELTFTPSIFVNKTKSEYNDELNDDSKYNFNISNAGFVYSYKVSNKLQENGWKNVQFGFGLNKNNNFNNRMLIEGYNNNNSLLTEYLDYAKGIRTKDLQSMYPFDVNLAYKTDLIFTDSLGNYYCDMPDGNILQRKSINTGGSMNETVLSFGANYNDRLYLGATIGFPNFKYTEESSYSEIDINNKNDYFDSFTLHNYLETKGSGFNLKFGMILRATDWFRIGAAVHTPTFFNIMNDKWHSSMDSYFDNGNHYYKKSPQGNYDYKLETPMRALGSIAFIIGKYGLLSADYEFVDYSDSRLRSENDFYNENRAIQNKYKAQGNLHLGTEWRLDKFSIRGGYAHYASPYKNNINDAERTSYSFGFGYRVNNYFIDMAYVYTNETKDYYLYDAYYVNPVNNKIKSNNILVSLGFKF